MHIFDYSEILGSIPQDIARIMSEIAGIRSLEGVRRTNYPKDYARMESIARLASIKYSNEIEGIATSDERLEEIIIRGGAPRNHSEEEIAGYRDALNLIHAEIDRLSFDRNTILDLHSMLHTKGSDKRAFKDRDNAIISMDQTGRRCLVFEPVPASETEDCMEQLCLAYQELSTQGYDPLLYIPCIIVDYLCIHPFLDGNGRTSRLLTMLLLYKEGIDVCRYVSMDEHISFTKSDYYYALQQSSHGWMENRWTYFPFIRYFLRTLLECFMDIDTRFAIVDGKGLNRKQTIENVLKKSAAPMSLKQLQMVLKDVSIHTIQKEVKNLLSEGRIDKIGNTKGARYVYKRRLGRGQTLEHYSSRIRTSHRKDKGTYSNGIQFQLNYTAVEFSFN